MSKRSGVKRRCEEVAFCLHRLLGAELRQLKKLKKQRAPRRRQSKRAVCEEPGATAGGGYVFVLQ